MNCHALAKLLLVISAVYPHLVEKTFQYKSWFTQLNQTFPWFSGVSQSKFKANRSGVYELWSDKQTIKQIYKQRLLLYMYK